MPQDRGRRPVRSLRLRIIASRLLASACIVRDRVLDVRQDGILSRGRAIVRVDLRIDARQPRRKVVEVSEGKIRRSCGVTCKEDNRGGHGDGRQPLSCLRPQVKCLT
jgi:hypothetical protein